MPKVFPPQTSWSFRTGADDDTESSKYKSILQRVNMNYEARYDKPQVKVDSERVIGTHVRTFKIWILIPMLNKRNDDVNISTEYCLPLANFVCKVRRLKKTDEKLNLKKLITKKKKKNKKKYWKQWEIVAYRMQKRRVDPEIRPNMNRQYSRFFVLQTTP